MFQFPGEGTNILLKDGKPLFLQPIPKIGSIVTCRVHKALPYQLHLFITDIESCKSSIEYKAVLRLQDYRADIAENTFLDDNFRIGDVFDAIIVSFGDNYGCYVSTISDNMGIVKKILSCCN
ncbi:exosome 3'-_5 exonuclease subunit ski4 (Csl4) [Conglomerata obtusa]